MYLLATRASPIDNIRVAIALSFSGFGPFLDTIQMKEHIALVATPYGCLPFDIVAAYNTLVVIFVQFVYNIGSES